MGRKLNIMVWTNYGAKQWRINPTNYGPLVVELNSDSFHWKHFPIFLYMTNQRIVEYQHVKITWSTIQLNFLHNMLKGFIRTNCQTSLSKHYMYIFLFMLPMCSFTIFPKLIMFDLTFRVSYSLLLISIIARFGG